MGMRKFPVRREFFAARSGLMRCLLLFCAIFFGWISDAPAQRPAAWAQPVTSPALSNLHRVDKQLYRCAQPSKEGLRELERMGVRTVINLRDNHDDVEEGGGTKLRLLRLEMTAWDMEDERVARVLALLREKEHGPFAIHCRHGSDRTGVVCAMYRMVEQGWSREDALREMREGGYGFHRVFVNLARYLQRVDIEKVRRRVDELAPKRP